VWALEIYFDAESEDRVESIWASIDAAGGRSLGSVPGTEYRPHVSLAVFEEGDRRETSGALSRILEPCLGMPLTLASLGFFLSPGAVAFLGVTPTEHLLDVHRRVHTELAALTTASWSLYEPGNYVPHCTLAMGFDNLTPIVNAIAADQLPVHAVAREAHLVEISRGRSVARLA